MAFLASGCGGVASAPTTLGLENGLPSNEVRAVLIDGEESVWLGFRDDGLVHLSAAGMRRWDSEDGLVSDGVADLHQDRDGRIWAVGLGGYTVLDRGEWTAHTRFGGLEPRVVFSVHEATDGGGFWLGTSAGAVRVGDGAPETVTAADGLPHAVVHAVAVGRDGTTWFATRNGLAGDRGDGIETLYKGTNFRSAVIGPDGAVWLGTSDGAWEIRGDERIRHLEGRTLVVPLVTGDGMVWAVSEGEGAYRLRAGRWRRFSTADGLPSDTVYDAAQGPDGAIWLATAAGAVRLEPDR